MLVRIWHISLYLFLVFTFALAIFCYGFFPLSFSPSTKSNITDLPGSLDNVQLNTKSYKPRNSRAVLMVIDALRTDFVSQKNNMPFLNQLIKDGRACQYQLQVHPPTVTMPRIKAMTSGAIPSFLDVILNLGSPRVKLDTFLYQMLQLQRRMVFYGDNTWTNMFPNYFSRKGENVDSLYVNDFYEGDQNITNQMRIEFNNYDWKMMILHFLGLDHIGHVEGPFSDKVPGKLKEMDSVIEEIYEAMKIWDEKYHSKSLLVITGDHGMRDAGGHGGSTHPETRVPLVVLGNNCSNSADNFLQIDVAPTFAVLMGVPIPYSSIGSLINPILNHIPPLDRLHAIYYNTKRLIEKSKVFYGNELSEQDFFIQYKEAKLLHSMYLNDQDDMNLLQQAMGKYNTASRNLSSLLIKHYIRYDIPSIVIGIILGLVTTGLATMLCMIPYEIEQIEFQPKPERLMFLLIAGVGGNCYFSALDGIETDILRYSFISNLLFTLISQCIAIHWSLLESIVTLLSIRKMANLFKLPGCLLVFGCIVHMLSLASSSFIEEEHQTWYYFNNSWFLLITLIEFRKMNRTIRQIGDSKSNEVLLSHCKWERVQFCVSTGLFFFGHILLRRWNQTGDKWQHVPDVGDWFGKEENKFWLSLILFFGLCYLLFSIARFTGCLTIILSLTACMLIYYYRVMIGSVSFWSVVLPKHDFCIYFFWITLMEIYLIALLPRVYRAVKRQTEPNDSQLLINFLCVILLISAFIHKPHNVILVGAIVSSSGFLVHRINNIAKSKAENMLLKTVAHFWLGKMFYFYQGNSNNLATVDLNAGYVGLSSFNFALVGLFLTLNTFNGQILSFLMLVYHLARGIAQNPIIKSAAIEKRAPIVKQYLVKVLGLLIMVPLTFYLLVVALMRNHIFVWTVFSPKIIYDCFYTVMFFIQFIVISCIFY